MIIFGFKTFVKRLTTILMICRHCNNQAANHLIRRKLFFTLFFIPIIPISSKYYITCTYCGKSGTISKQDAMALVNTSNEQMQSQNGYLQSFPSQQNGTDPNLSQPYSTQPNLYGNTYPNMGFEPQQYSEYPPPPEVFPNQDQS